jgi:hypothetical protein
MLQLQELEKVVQHRWRPQDDEPLSFVVSKQYPLDLMFILS